MDSNYGYYKPVSKLTKWDEDKFIDYEKERLEYKKLYPIAQTPILNSKPFKKIQKKSIQAQTDISSFELKQENAERQNKNLNQKINLYEKHKKKLIFSIISTQIITIIFLVFLILFLIVYYRYRSREITIYESHTRFISYDYSGLCPYEQYFNGSKCIDRVGELQSCGFNYDCFRPMKCDAVRGCTCDTYFFYDASKRNCESQYLNQIGECLTDNYCRSNSGLYCNLATKLCVCDSASKSWSSTELACKLTYNKGTCNTDSDCNLSENLFCQTGTSCQCPQTVTNNKCDCKRVIGNENYWNSSQCVAALSYKSTCTADYMCKSLVENLKCVSGKCDCEQSTHSWSSVDSKCMPTYENGACTIDSDCNTSEDLICKTGTSCNCPKTVGNNKCDCIRISGNEKYWNNTKCVPALTYQDTCTHTYMCKTLAENLQCISGKCDCDSSSFSWSSNESKCKLTYNKGTCNSDSDCNSNENLICNSGNNKCTCIKIVGDEKYWNNTYCVPAISYGSVTCTNDIMCKTLTEHTYCDLATGKCDCPSPGGLLSSGTCRQCLSDEFFFADLCYHITPNRYGLTPAENQCNSRSSSKLAVLNTADKINFIKGKIISSESYWISGSKVGGVYNWGPTDSSMLVDLSLCSLSGTQSCLSFTGTCFNTDTPCNQNNYVICQI
ncbi:unnamed protein product [Brachionus calyciflorus]|uniref:C-type lectin domain-containing protein n=1 Tax=Brachionus calyciflorus TaxID=104777 RepID=A0A813PVH7_9BILA|nr:unnamed protein product [Brachionus calyciflorus]